MQQEAPSLLWITMHDIDVAHSGAYSLYVDAIRRTDRLCAELWKAVQSEPEYAGNTTMFVLPDFGRDSDYDAGGNGFQHHRTGDAASRTTWMMALGAGVRQGVVYDIPCNPSIWFRASAQSWVSRPLSRKANLSGSCCSVCCRAISNPSTFAAILLKRGN